MYTRVIPYVFRVLSTPSLQQEFGAFERRDVKLQEDMVHLRAQVKKLQVRFDTVVYYREGEYVCIWCMNM